MAEEGLVVFILLSCILLNPCLGQFFNGLPSSEIVRTASIIKNQDPRSQSMDDVIESALARIKNVNDATAGSPRGSGVKVNPVLQSSSENRPSFLRTNPEQSLDSQFSTQGSARTFNPQENPLAQRTRPRVQQLLEETKLTGNENKQLSHDFLPSCPDATFSYIIPSPTQCDLYYQCEFGTPSRKLCEDGQVFSITDVKCVSSNLADCEDRPLLQEPKGTGPCERRNGIFYTNQTCTEFVTCRDNNPFFERCAPGLVFDPVQKICAWADEALRPGCLPEDLLGFRCPNPKLTQEQALLARVHLRFGDHDRFSDPKDCRYFFMCLRTGQPRRAGCPQGKVFEELSGSCKLAKDVPECSNYYGANVQSSEASRAQATKLQNIEDDIQKQFNDERLRLRQLRVKRWIMEEEASPE
ncbi:uncharacterized protein LOC111697884 [Eurytemora carolleeae]|uniref:uncharacterized protein LOC111697884 n=1 Tax=Eurytemora carolleeae TaxID=1294199 RepID=UPI000C76A78C|nr:uncharacterized protein LOC111697884 [Eurytemora carolleeae]|eukprot:XP_023323787.1 uncharacterized protein LOC111697884 [Eurytemora affinis]